MRVGPWGDILLVLIAQQGEQGDKNLLFDPRQIKNKLRAASCVGLQKQDGLVPCAGLVSAEGFVPFDGHPLC